MVRRLVPESASSRLMVLVTVSSMLMASSQKPDPPVAGESVNQARETLQALRSFASRWGPLTPLTARSRRSPFLPAPQPASQSRVEGPHSVC